MEMAALQRDTLSAGGAFSRPSLTGRPPGGHRRGVVWGAASPLIKSTDVGGAALSFYRLWIGALALLLVVTATRRSFRDLPWKWRRDPRAGCSV